MGKVLASSYNRIERQNPTQMSLFAVGGAGGLYLACTALFLSIIIHGKITDFFGDSAEDIRFFAIFLAVCINIFCAILCLVRGLVLASLLSILSLVGIFIFVFIFSQNSGVPFTWAAGGEYFGYSFLGVFLLVIDDRKFHRLLRTFYYMCIAYAIFYAIATLAIQNGFIDLGGASRVFVGADDAGRDDRLAHSSMALVFGTMLSLTRIFRNFNIKDIAILVLFAFDWYLTSSRLISIVVLVIALYYVATRNITLISKTSFAIYILGTIFSIYMIFFPENNPYYYSTDASGQIRIMSVYIAADRMADYWITGAGIGYGVEAFSPIAGSKYFYPSDIGMIGILFSYGIFGFLFYMTLTFLSISVYKPMLLRGYSLQLAEALTLSASVFAIYSLQAAHFDSNTPASVLAMMAAAFVLDRRHRGTGPRLNAT